MKTLKKIVALGIVILLLGLYVLTFVAACLKTEYSNSLFMASIYSTIVVPIMLYGYLLMYRVLKGRGVDKSADVASNDQDVDTQDMDEQGTKSHDSSDSKSAE